MYAAGDELPKNPLEELKWYRRAAAAGAAKASVVVASRFLADGRSATPEESAEASRRREDAAKNNFSPGAYCVAQIYRRGWGRDELRRDPGSAELDRIFGHTGKQFCDDVCRDKYEGDIQAVLQVAQSIKPVSVATYRGRCAYKPCGKGKDARGLRARARVPKFGDFCSEGCWDSDREVQKRKEVQKDGRGGANKPSCLTVRLSQHRFFCPFSEDSQGASKQHVNAPYVLHAS
jgi:hypothetical protein